MSYDKHSGKYGMFSLEGYKEAGPGKTGNGDDSAGPVDSTRRPLRMDSIKPTLVGMSSPAPTASPDNVMPIRTNASNDALKAIVSASTLFASLVNARGKMAHLADISDPDQFDEMFRMYATSPREGDAFMRELSYWLSGRLVRVEMVTGSPPEDGWFVDQSLDEKVPGENGGTEYKILQSRGPVNVNIRKGDRKLSITLRRILKHNMMAR